jgi:hypothetical protein
MAKAYMSFDDAREPRFPAVCVRSGDEATETMPVAVLKAKPPLKLMLPVSARVARHRRDLVALALTSTVGGLVLIGVGWLSDVDVAVVFGLFCSLAALVLTVLALQTPGVTAKAKDGGVELDHVHQRFAAALDGRGA